MTRPGRRDRDGRRRARRSCSAHATRRRARSCEADAVRYRRMPIEVESPEQLGYDTITNNLSESSVADRRLSDLGIDLGSALDEMLLCYGDHLGNPALREAVAAGGDGLRADDVLVTPGAAAALFATATSLLEPGDHAVIVRTNYATNLETPRAIGAELDIVDVTFEDAWQLDVARIAARVRPGATRLISVTCPHNPTGTMFDLASLRAGRARRELGRGAARRRDLPRPDPRGRRCRWRPRCRRGRSACRRCRRPTGCRACASVGRCAAIRSSPRRCWPPRSRCSSAAPPSTRRSPASCSPTGRASCPRSSTTFARGSGSCASGWPASRRSSGSSPRAASSVSCASAEVAVDTDRFYELLLAKHGTYVGPGHWFEVDDRHFRLGFGWPTEAELRAGLAALSAAAQDDRLIAPVRLRPSRACRTRSGRAGGRRTGTGPVDRSGRTSRRAVPAPPTPHPAPGDAPGGCRVRGGRARSRRRR